MRDFNDIAVQSTGDLLTERRAPSQPPPHSLRIDSFKGMTESQIEEIRECRRRQVAELEAKREREKNTDSEWDKYNSVMSRTTMLMDRERERLIRKKNIDEFETNKVLAAEFEKRKKYLDKIVYSNPPTQDFFGQFNTTSR